MPGAHKTETGGIALDLATEADVRAAVERIGLPVVIQPMIGGGAELLAGVVQDPTFGPLVAFGPGGVFAELIGEAQFRIAPLTLADAEDLVLTGKAGRLVAGFRGKPPADAAALVDLVLRLARLADDVPEVAELDLNPVLGLPNGCVAVDARVRAPAGRANPSREDLVAPWRGACSLPAVSSRSPPEGSCTWPAGPRAGDLVLALGTAIVLVPLTWSVARIPREGRRRGRRDRPDRDRRRARAPRVGERRRSSP